MTHAIERQRSPSRHPIVLLVRREVREKRFLRSEKEESSRRFLFSIAPSSAPASPAAGGTAGGVAGGAVGSATIGAAGGAAADDSAAVGSSSGSNVVSALPTASTLPAAWRPARPSATVATATRRRRRASRTKRTTPADPRGLRWSPRVTLRVLVARSAWTPLRVTIAALASARFSPSVTRSSPTSAVQRSSGGPWTRMSSAASSSSASAVALVELRARR